eukprot:c3340_g1_i1.p1 GENE.c3340_g1_i1~~c3340_g1_i1.p1  ORF type:complete len:172 (+),score=26.47 c3340_g1_i1:38-553(+)
MLQHQSSANSTSIPVPPSHVPNMSGDESDFDSGDEQNWQGDALRKARYLNRMHVRSLGAKSFSEDSNSSDFDNANAVGNNNTVNSPHAPIYPAERADVLSGVRKSQQLLKTLQTPGRLEPPPSRVMTAPMNMNSPRRRPPTQPHTVLPVVMHRQVMSCQAHVQRLSQRSKV